MTGTTQHGDKRRHGRVALLLAGLVACMTGLAFASVPLYRLFCQVTGYGGTPQRAEQAPAEILDRTIRVRFDANVDRELPWRFVPVERENREAAMASIARGAQSLRDGNSFLIFPEGTRSRTRQLLPFKKDGFIMALQAGAPIVPVAIDGGRAAMRKGSVLVWPTTVTVTIGKPIETADMTLEDRDQLIARVRDDVQRMLG